MSSPRLIFHPKCADTVVPEGELLDALADIGLIAGPLAGNESNCFAAGEAFIELLTFLGCSPVINLSPDDGDNYCFIELFQFEHARLIHGDQAFQPRCKQCRATIENWREQTAQSSSVVCPACGHSMGLDEVNWKQAAGFASQFIVVHNIYLHEAVPGEKLMSTLEALTGGQGWRYFYAL